MDALMQPTSISNQSAKHSLKTFPC